MTLHQSDFSLWASGSNVKHYELKVWQQFSLKASSLRVCHCSALAFVLTHVKQKTQKHQNIFWLQYCRLYEQFEQFLYTYRKNMVPQDFQKLKKDNITITVPSNHQSSKICNFLLAPYFSCCCWLKQRVLRLKSNLYQCINKTLFKNGINDNTLYLGQICLTKSD